MKLSTACVVFAAFAAAAVPARADPQAPLPVETLGNVFSELIQAQALIKTVEKRNYEFLTPTLGKISRELHQGLNSNIFNIGINMRMALVDVNLKVGQISGNATSIVAQIESVALTINSLQFSSAKLDYEVKKLRIKKLCQDTLHMTTVVVNLIDETKETLSKNVSIPLGVLQHTISIAQDEGKMREMENIEKQTRVINNPFSDLFGIKKFFTGYDVRQAARDLVQQGYATIKRVEDLVASIVDHAKWLDKACQTIKDHMDKDRDTVSAMNGTISGTSGSLNSLVETFDTLFGGSGNMSDEFLREGSSNLLKMMNELRDSIRNITRNRTRRAVGSYYEYETEVFPPTTFLEQPVKPSWLDNTPVNGCFYIYNNRTTGCIFIKTFEYMKMHYIWLSNMFIEQEALFKVHEKSWNNSANLVLSVSKNNSHQYEANEFVADLKTNKLLWRDEIETLRDLSVSLNSYAESLFSDENAQLKITRINDVMLNEYIMAVVDNNKKAAVNIIT